MLLCYTLSTAWAGGVMNQLFLNPHHIMVWRKANSRTVRENPDNQSVLLVQLGLNRLYSLYGQKPNVEGGTNTVREKIFSYFEEVAENGNSSGIFFEGLCRLFGLGCKIDIIIDNTIIRVAVIACGCDFALDCINLCVKVEYLYGKNRPQNYAAAITCLNMAGEIAQPQRAKLAEHFKHQYLKHTQFVERQQAFLGTSYKP